MADEPITQDAPVPTDVAEPTDAPQPAAKTFTQDELNSILTKRLERERKSWQAELEAERLKEQMTAEERLKADLDAERSKAQTAIEKANQRAITAEARAQAASLGIKPERLGHALKLADLSGATVDEAGEPDSTAIRAALEAVLTDLPELKGAAASVGGGSNPPGGSNAGKLDISQLSPDEFTALQQRIMRGEHITP